MSSVDICSLFSFDRAKSQLIQRQEKGEIHKHRPVLPPASSEKQWTGFMLGFLHNRQEPGVDRTVDTLKSTMEQVKGIRGMSIWALNCATVSRPQVARDKQMCQISMDHYHTSECDSYDDDNTSTVPLPVIMMKSIKGKQSTTGEYHVLHPHRIPVRDAQFWLTAWSVSMS